MKIERMKQYVDICKMLGQEPTLAGAEEFRKRFK